MNDVAISVRWLLEAGHARRILVLDLDVHQGNGTASMLSAERLVLTVSVHAQSNYPFHKERSGLDVALPDGTGMKLICRPSRRRWHRRSRPSSLIFCSTWPGRTSWPVISWVAWP
ncbi:hypothetical protein ACFSC4_02415 [Deinococcus malanensis]|uniref:hypothetical protein n=1 Tax=Deinococcus malanensis TaxID=1706855 RepID=UPI0036449E31